MFAVPVSPVQACTVFHTVLMVGVHTLQVSWCGELGTVIHLAFEKHQGRHQELSALANV